MREGSERHGFGAAAKEAHFIAAPLLTAAALSLAGVVAGADDAFRWPGITLLLLVATSMTLVASIQMSYYALQFKFTEAERKERQKARAQEALHLAAALGWEDGRRKAEGLL